MSALRWTRTDGDASEILTVVRIEGRVGLAVEVCAGPAIGDEFVGLYDLDGDALNLASGTWEAVDECELTTEQIESIRLDWESGTSTVERFGGE